MQETWVWSLGWEDLLEKERPPTRVLWSGEFHGLRCLAGYSPWGRKESELTQGLSLSHAGKYGWEKKEVCYMILLHNSGGNLMKFSDHSLFQFSWKTLQRSSLLPLLWSLCFLFHHLLTLSLNHGVPQGSAFELIFYIYSFWWFYQVSWFPLPPPVCWWLPNFHKHTHAQEYVESRGLNVISFFLISILIYPSIYSTFPFWYLRGILRGFPGGTSGEDPPCQFRRHKRHRCNSWVRKIPCRRAKKPTPVFLTGESYRQRRLANYIR